MRTAIVAPSHVRFRIHCQDHGLDWRSQEFVNRPEKLAGRRDIGLVLVGDYRGLPGWPEMARMIEAYGLTTADA